MFRRTEGPRPTRGGQPISGAGGVIPDPIIDAAPDLAREIVRRGHGAADHGRTWESSYVLDADAERRFIADSVDDISKATGQPPEGWNACWMRSSLRTLDLLQSLGFTCHTSRRTC